MINDDTLLEAASLIPPLATRLCRTSYLDMQSCHWYHSAWPYLRVLDLVSNPGWHGEFYDRSLDVAYSRGGLQKVLICGAADFSTLSVLHRAANVAGIELDATVLDACPVPLVSSMLYAQRAGIAIQPVWSNVQNLTWATFGIRYDVIATDAFLTRFNMDGAAEVLKLWHGALSKDGIVVTTIRLHDNESDDRKATADEIAAYLDRARASLTQAQSRLPACEGDIMSAISGYAYRMTSNPLGSESDLRDLFERCGFVLVDSEVAGVRGEFKPSRYLRVCAMKDG